MSRVHHYPRPTRIAGLGLVCVLAWSCSDRAMYPDVADGTASGPAGAATGLTVPPAAEVSETGAQPIRQSARDPMVIRTGSAHVEVDSLQVGLARVTALAARVGGTVVSSLVQTGARQRREASLSLRIPAARFQEAVTGLAPVGRLESLHVNTEDVGEEFVDLSARLASAQQLEQRLLEILRTRTGRLEDVLALERELARVRADIERHEGRLRYLRNRVDMSVLAVALHEPTPILATAPGVNVIGQALRQAWRNFVAVCAAAIATLGFLTPLGVLAGAALLGWRRARQRTAPGAPAA